MKKRNLLFAAIFAMVTFAGLSVKAQDSVFSYTYQGTTLYYIIDNDQQARVVPPLYPDLYYNADSTESSAWYGYAEPQGNVVVPDSVMFNGTNYPVTAVEAYAFFCCYDVTSVTLPASITYLEHDAFTECSLETITMPGVTYMGEGCFYIAYALTSVDIPAGVTFIPDWCFDQCSALQTVTFHEGLTSIGYCGFQLCSNLQSVTFPESLTTIGGYAFCACSSLLSVTLPESLTTVGIRAFDRCSSLQSLNIPGSVNDIPDWCFNQCNSLATVTLHEGTETIGFCAFRECYNLTTINYPSTLEEIGSFSFQFDTALAIPLILPEGLTTLGVVVYGDCKNIVTASLPSSIGEVPDELFYGCTSLAKVTIGDGITAINEQAFNHCPNIDTFYVNCAVPPTVGPLSDSTFFTYNSTVVVPCGSEEAYRQHSAWGLFSDIVEDCGVGIPEANMPNFTIRVANSCIVVDSAEGEIVRVFDISGRQVNNSGLSNGVYIVKVGNYPAKKVVVSPTM